MKLSKIYSNKPDIFSPINFKSGLNVVMARIHLPENQDKDTHNLGKTILGKMIDFCLLSKHDRNFFLFKHKEIFNEFVFFLEIELMDSSHITIRRDVGNATKISFKKHQAKDKDFTYIEESEWDHCDVPFNKARELLDNFLDWRDLAKWTFRKELGYLIRSQDSFRDVFQLGKFIGHHAGWKPFIAHILGFDANIISEHYSKEEKLKEKKEFIIEINKELGVITDEDTSKIDGILHLKRKEINEKQKFLNSFDFRNEDKIKTENLVEEIDVEISNLNSMRYRLNKNIKKITMSLEEEQILFKLDEAKHLFDEVGISFAGQIKKDFDQLITFNKAITEERKAYLQEEKIEIEKELEEINSRLNDIGKERSQAILYLTSADVFEKYKLISDELIKLKTDVSSLEHQRKYLQNIQKLRSDERSLNDEIGKLQTKIEEDVSQQNRDESSFFSKIRDYFNEIVKEVINRKAILSVDVNRYGHLEFKAEILRETEELSSADSGFTYKKLLCIAFDMAVLRAHINNKFPRFIYHDGIFEALDDRKKGKLLAVIRKYTEIGIQSIITVIESDIPDSQNGKSSVFEDDEIVLTLHDEGQDGRLFKMEQW